jgi:hypothetical protein
MEVGTSVTTLQVKLSLASTMCRTTGSWSPAFHFEGLAGFDPGVVHVGFGFVMHRAALGQFRLQLRFLVTILSLPHIHSSLTVG